jgi:endonuclease VIII
MPEGDTIFRAARTLNRALGGKVVTAFDSVFPHLTRVHEDAPITGRTVESVRAIGKHLLIEVSGGLILRTHMRMNGSWHIYRSGERWRRGLRDMRVLVATADFVAVAFNVHVAEFIRAVDLPRHGQLRRLGPDLAAEDFDEHSAMERLRERSGEPIADVLLDQRVMAGIGNVFKSEVLFVCRIDPFASAGSLTDDQRRHVIATARRLLRVNVQPSVASMTTYGGFRRTTGRDNPAERLWVYGRGGKPCRRCGTAISVKKQGPAARLTYWCGNCQKGPAAG